MNSRKHPVVRVVVRTTGVIVLAGTTLTGYAVYREWRERLRANSTIVNKTLPVHAEWWTKHAEVEGELLYAIIGDSTAQGIGASAPHFGYVGRLADVIRERTGRTVRVINLSVSGATVTDAVANQLPTFATLQPDIATVAIGANDIANFDPVVFENKLRVILDAVPEGTIVADLPYFYFPKNEAKVAVANSILYRLAAERSLTVVPLHAAMKKQGLRGALTQFAKDLFHPNDHGYRVWASAFEPALVAQLAERFPDAVSTAPAAPGVTV